MHIARPRIAAAEKVKQQRAQCDAETDGQLLVYRHQAVAAAFHLRPQIGQGQRIHRRILQRIAHTEHKQNRHNQPNRRRRIRQSHGHNQQTDNAGIPNQHPAVAEADNQRLHKRLGQQSGQRHGRKHLSRHTRTAHKGHLKQQGHQKRHRPHAQTTDQVAQNPQAERPHQTQARRIQREVAVVPRMPPIAPQSRQTARTAQSGKQTRARMHQQLHRQAQPHCSGTEKQKTGQIEMRHAALGRGKVGHDFRRPNNARQTDGHID